MCARLAPHSFVLLLVIGLTTPALAQKPPKEPVQVVRQVENGMSADGSQRGVPPLERRITLKLVTVPLDQALEEIASRAELTLGYDPQLIPVGAVVSVDAQAETAAALLESVLQSTGLTIKQLGVGQVTLVRVAPNATEALSETGSITGKISSRETGAGVSGAAVRIVGTGFGTLTRSDGTYRLDAVPAGEHTLSVSVIGYAAQQRSVSVVSGESTIADFVLTISAVSLEQVVVTGSVAATELRAVPTPVTMITGEDMQRNNVQGIEDLFQGMTPGAVSFTRDPGNVASFIAFRGSTDIGAGSASSVKTYIDGVEATTARFASISPDMIDRVEVVRGPQAATLYGPEAINGVIQIFTKKGIPGDRPRLSTKMSFGAIQSDYQSGLAEEHDHSVSVSGGGDAYSYSFTGAYQSVGEWIPDYSSRTPSFQAGATIRQGALSLDLSARRSETAYVTPQNPILRDRGFAPWQTPDRSRHDVGQQTHSVRVAYSPTPDWSHTVLIGQDALTSENYRTEPRLRTPTDTSLDVTSSRSERFSFGYTTVLHVNPTARLSSVFTAGFDHYQFGGSTFVQSNTSRITGILDGNTGYTSRVATTNTGFFGQAQVGINRVAYLTAGIRADRNSEFGTEIGMAVSPRIGIAATHERGSLTLKTRASYGEAIRPPAPARKLGSTTPQSRFLPNPDLGPEVQRGWDAGIDIVYDSRIRLGITRYDQLAEGLIDNVRLDPDPNTGQLVFQAQNIGEVVNRGWELEGRGSIGRFSFGATYSIMTSRIESVSPTYTGSLRVGEQLAGVPSYAAGLQAAVQVGRNTDLGLTVAHRGEWTQLDMLAYYGFVYGGEPYRGSLREYYTEHDPITTLDVRATHRLSTSLQGFLQVENIGGVSRSQMFNADPTPARTFRLGLRFET